MMVVPAEALVQDERCTYQFQLSMYDRKLDAILVAQQNKIVFL